MTKFVLILYICSIVSNTCNNGFVPGLEFSNHYDCAEAGYSLASASLKELDKETVNKERIAIKFECRPVNFVVPKPKPKGDPA